MASLESAAGVNFAASTDATGNSGSKGHWILETDGIDLKNVYFNPEKLDRFKGLLWGYEKVLHEDQWVVDGGQYFGSSVSLSGDHALAGACGSMHAYVYADPTAPDTQAENIGFGNVAQGQMDVSWSRGNGDRVLVVARQGAAVGSDPVDGASYTADAVFGSGSEIGAGNFVVYKGTGTGALNNGDANGDGIKDSLQTDVVLLPSATNRAGTYLTVVVTGCDRLENVRVCTCASVGKPDPGYEYPFNLIGFDIPCASATVRIYYHGATSFQGFDYRKYGPTPDDWNTAVWYSMPGTTFGSQIIDRKRIYYVEFLLTEAQLGDDTPVFPIVDQGGVALPNVIPTLNEWRIISLFLLMVGIALCAMRRRRAGH